MNRKTVPNQKVVKINKMGTKGKIFAQIEMETLEAAAQDLAAGAFKLWIYFAKNQNEYEFALSSKYVEETFGIKKKQYDNAVKELIEKGYLANSAGNYYFFYENPVVSKRNNESKEENPVVPKRNNDVVPKRNNDVVPKGNNALYQKDTRNITNITKDITKDITDEKRKKMGKEKEKLSFSYGKAILFLRENYPAADEEICNYFGRYEYLPYPVRKNYIEETAASYGVDIEILDE